MAKFFKYKDQVTVNLDNVTFIKVDDVETDGKCAVRLHSTDGFEKHYVCDSRLEAIELEKSIVEMFGKVIDSNLLN